MKRILLSFGLCLLMAGMSFGQTTTIDFETLDDGYTASATEGTSGSSTDIFNRTNPNIGGNSTFIWAAEDLSLSNPSLTLDQIDVTGSTFFTFSFDLLTPNSEDWDTTDELLITYSLDGGSSQNLLWVQSNEDGDAFNAPAAIDLDFDGTGDDGRDLPAITDGSGAGVGSDFATFSTQSIPLSSNSTLDITLQFNNLTSAAEGIYIDNIVIEESTSSIPDLIVDGDAGWRMLSFPISGGAADDISDDTAIQGVSGGDNTGATSNFQTYDDSGAFETPTNVSTAIGNGYGFIAYFYNNSDAGSSVLPVTLDATGTQPGSDVDVDLNTTVTESSSYFTLVGNPFASNFDLSSITATGGSIQNNVAFWNDGAGSYVSKDRTSSYIASSWQGFWVETTSASVTQITFPTTGKSTSANSGAYFTKENPDNADIEFTLSSESSFDEAIKLSFRSYAELGMDRADASKLVPLVSEYATMAFVGEYQNEEKLKSVESLPVDLEEAITIPLRPTLVGVSGEFTFSWNGLEELSNKMSFTLHDYETGSNIDMSEVDSYVFMAEANTASKSNSVLLPVVAESESNDAENRFGITITPNTSVGIDDELDSPTKFALDQNYPNPFNPTTNIQYSVGEAGPVTITVYNVMGQKVAELLNTTKSAGSYQVSWNATGQASGIYYYRLSAPGQVLTRQMTLIK